MPRINILKQSEIKKTPRLIQLQGLFDVTPTEKINQSWSVDLPIDDFEWNVGLIVGASGSGKTTIAKELFKKECFCNDFKWDKEKSLIDSFPEEMGIKEITELLSSVGFSSAPYWLKPFHVLSNGEQFRVNMARVLAEKKDLVVIDEFTSVVDRTVAKIGSSAISKLVKRKNKKMIALSCHYDIIEWLEPDWIYEPETNKFTRGLVRRPSLNLKIVSVKNEAWKLFSKYHYLNTELNKSARSFVAFWDDIPVAFTSVLSFPHAYNPAWKEHRTVCLPDFQGVGIGNKLSEYVASLYKATGKTFFSTTSNPAMIRYRTKSKLWQIIRKPCINPNSKNKFKTANNRYTVGFEYIGKPNLEDALSYGLIK